MKPLRGHHRSLTLTLSHREKGRKTYPCGTACLVTGAYVHWAKAMAHPVPAGER